MAKDILETKEIQSLLSENTNRVISDFLTYYDEGSHPQYSSAIYKLFYEIGKTEVRELQFVDYIKINNESNRTTQDSYRSAFFQYLFAFELLDNPAGFDDLWIKNSSIKKYEKQKNKLVRKNIEENEEAEKEEIPLALVEIAKIEDRLSRDYPKLDMLKKSFLWYMLFQTDCSVGELKVLKSGDFVDGAIKTNNNRTFSVPDCYHTLFEQIDDRSKYNGFQTINLLIEQLGVLAGVQKLTPRRIKNAREANMIVCGNCGNKYSNLAPNWVAVLNRVICVKCAEELKKNKQVVVVEELSTEEVQILCDPEHERNILPIVLTFDELREKVVIPETDYLELHKLQIEIGKLGEAFVYDLECKKLDGTRFKEHIDPYKASDPKNGYDILSYDMSGKELFIEVKTTVLNESEFFLTTNELNVARQMRDQGKTYLIYRVSNILDQNKDNIKCEIIEDITTNQDYVFEEALWKVKRSE